MHITDLRKFVRCPKMYKLSLADESRHFPYFNINIDTDDSIIHKLGIENYYTGFVNEDNESTFRAFQQYSWLIRARFSYRNLRVRIPFLYHEGNTCDLYFSSFSVYPTDSEAVNIRWSIEVLTKLNLTIRNIYMIHPDKTYIREGEIDHDKLWVLTDRFYNSVGNPGKLIREKVDALNYDIDIMLDELLHFDGFDDFTSVRSSNCLGKNKCSYYDICFPEDKNIPDDSVLNLVSSQYKYQMYDEGIKYLSQVDLNRFEGTPQQYAQIMADRKGGVFCDKIALSNWMDKYGEFPKSFVDFEWDLYLVPPYSGMSPVQVMPFQYSLHVMQQDGSIQHYQYIGEGDCRQEFIESLIRDLPETGPIFAYNAKGAEIIRLSEFQKAFPQYNDVLETVKSRFADLAAPFVNGLFYDIRMRGYYSLKVIQGIIDREYTYKDLEIENGLEAVRIYRLLQQCDDPQLKETYYQDLYKYCGLDSYAMIEVYNWLQQQL